jgi:multicomponent Na+:H+ antiporter subunit F
MLNSVLPIAFVLVGVGLLAAVVRLVLGPSRADRVVALDLIAVLLIAVSFLVSLYSGRIAFLDLALVLALVGFLATVAFARYLEAEPEPTGDGPRHRKVEDGAQANQMPGDE